MTSLLRNMLFQLIIFSPIFINSQLRTDSFAAGLFLSSILGFLFYSYNKNTIDKKNWNKEWFLLLILPVIILHTLIVLIFFELSDLNKFSTSISLLFIIITSAILLKNSVEDLKSDIFNKILNNVHSILLFMAIFCALDLQLPGMDGYAKTVFIFTEPSFFALVLAPFLCFMLMSINNNLFRMIIFFTHLILALIIQNTSYLIVVLFAILPIINYSKIIILLIGGLLILPFIDLSYYSDRLFDGSAVPNVSRLVYLQGVDMAISSLSHTNLVGLGFQQLGAGSYSSEISEKITELVGFNLNQTDGGFGASKLISEFGSVGMLLVLCLLFVAIKSFLMIAKLHKKMAAQHKFFYCIIYMYVVNLFVRDAGYFTINSYLMFMALSWMTTKNGNKI